MAQQLWESRFHFTNQGSPGGSQQRGSESEAELKRLREENANLRNTNKDLKARAKAKAGRNLDPETLAALHTMVRLQTTTFPRLQLEAAGEAKDLPRAALILCRCVIEDRGVADVMRMRLATCSAQLCDCVAL